MRNACGELKQRVHWPRAEQGRCGAQRGRDAHLEELVGLVVARDDVQAGAGTGLSKEGIPEAGEGGGKATVEGGERGHR